MSSGRGPRQERAAGVLCDTPRRRSYARHGERARPLLATDTSDASTFALGSPLLRGAAAAADGGDGGDGGGLPSSSSSPDLADRLADGARAATDDRGQVFALGLADLVAETGVGGGQGGAGTAPPVTRNF